MKRASELINCQAFGTHHYKVAVINLCTIMNRTVLLCIKKFCYEKKSTVNIISSVRFSLPVTGTIKKNLSTY